MSRFQIDWTPEKEATIRKLARDGLTIKDIAARNGTSIGSIQRRLKEYGICKANQRGGFPDQHARGKPAARNASHS